MKKILILFTTLIIFNIFITPVMAKNNNYHTYDSKLLKYDEDNYYIITVKDKNFSCIGHNCYDFDSFYYNSQKQIYSINMIIDLMNWNSHETYKSSYDDGYISHLIFRTYLHNSKITTKCIGYVVSDIVPTYKNGQPYSMYYDNMIIHMVKPKSIKRDTKEIIISFYNWIDSNNFINTVKSLANK